MNRNYYKNKKSFLKRARVYYAWNNKKYTLEDFLNLKWVKKLYKTHSWHRPDMSGRLDQRHKNRMIRRESKNIERNYDEY